MPNPIRLATAQRLATRFCALRGTDDLAEWLHLPAYQLQLMAAKPLYYIFSVPKRDGTKRWIEDPDDRLQAVQARLNFALGVAYRVGLHHTAGTQDG